MKCILLFLGLITITACSDSVEKSIRANSENPVSKTDNLPKTVPERDDLDSAYFHILRRRYPTGIKYLEVYENKQTKLDHWTEYYENGHLKEEGNMTNSNHIPVGVWKYYSANGKTDSIINCDKKYPVSYFNALKIASGKGFNMPDLEVELTEENQKTYWKMIKWIDNGNRSTQRAEVILIDTKTGKVTKPAYITERIF